MSSDVEINLESDLNRNQKILRIIRFLLFGLGFISIFWFFFSFIGILYGILLFIFSKENPWKRNGILLAFSASISTFIAHVGRGTSPLYFAMATGPVIMGIYIIFLIIGFFLEKKGRRISIFSRLKDLKSSNSLIKVVSIILIIIPISLWSAVSIDLGVMFDNKPKLLWVNAPTNVNSGESFEITIEAWDSYERLSAIYKGTITFSLESYNSSDYSKLETINANLPNSYTFTGQNSGSDMAYSIRDGKDNGFHIFSMKITTIGIHYLLVNDSQTKNCYYSNPIIVDNYDPMEYRIFWGDIHTHSQFSDGTGTPEHNLYYGRYIAGLDYMALTDHGEILMWQPGAFETVERIINKKNEPFKFTTFQGLEWTDVKTGHYTIFFDGETLIKNPIISFMTIPTPQLLWNILDTFTEKTNQRAIALPHHMTKNLYPHDWTYTNPKYVRLAETSSVHGEFLFEHRDEYNYRGAIDPPPKDQNGTCVMDGLKMGYEVSLCAASDVHDGHPGHSISHTDAFVGHQRPLTTWHTRNEHPYPGGITAVFAVNNTRNSIFSGLYNQRVYGSSDHGRTYIDFSINGTRIGDGSTLVVDNLTDHRKINVIIAQDGNPACDINQPASVFPNWTPSWNSSVEIFKNGVLFRKVDINTPIASLEILDKEPITGADYGANQGIYIDGKYYVNEFSNNPVDPNLLNTNGADFYVIRIFGENHRSTFIGPIWVRNV